jgi:hypothetical protein
MRVKTVLVFVAATLFVSATTLAPVVTLTVLEGRSTTLYFNPAEIKIDKSVPWDKKKNEEGTLEFTAGEPKTMEMEFLFDGFEQKEDISPKVAGLFNIAEADPMMKRPPRVKVVWGNKLPAFEGVIESVSTKYTMFLPDGTPVRATCSVKFKEASKATFKKGSD